MKKNKFILALLAPNNTGKVARNTLFLTVSEFLLKLIGVLWIIYLARLFSVVEYGEYNLVTSFIAIFSFLPDFGVGLIVIREIARERKKASLHLGNSLILNGILSVFTFILILIVAFVSGFNFQVFILIFISAITLVISTIRSVAIFYFDGVEKMHYSAILNTLNTILLLSFAVLLSLIGFGLYGIFIGMLVGTVISTFITWICLFKYVTPTIRVKSHTILFYLKQGAPLGIASFSSLIYTHIDVLILSKLLGERAVGIYSAATPFAFALIQLLNVPFVVAVYPALSRLENEDRQRFKNGIIKSVGVILLWSIPSIIIISVFSPVIIPLIFGHKYDQAIPILKVLIFFVPFISMSALLYKVLIIIGKQKDYLIISIIGALINILLNVIFITKFGIFGAAWSAVLTQIFIFIIYCIDLRIRLKK